MDLLTFKTNYSDKTVNFKNNMFCLLWSYPKKLLYL